MVTLVSASGAPGVTTAVVGLGLTWPGRTIVVDADPRGGSAVLAGYFGGRVSAPDAMANLLLADRDRLLGDLLPQVLVPFPGSQAMLLPGPRTNAQARGLFGLWPSLATELRALEATATDVLVDAGRLGTVGFAEPLLTGADLVVLVVGSDLPSLAAARQWAESLAAAETAGGPLVRLVVVGEGRPYGARELERALGVPVIGSIPLDPKAAAVFSHGQEYRRLDASPLVRALRVLGQSLVWSVRTRTASLGVR